MLQHLMSKRTLNNVLNYIIVNEKPTTFDEYYMCREIETEKVLKSFLGSFKEVDVKKYPYLTESIFDKQGNEISLDLFKTELNIGVIVGSFFLSNEFDGLYTSYKEVPEELRKFISEEDFETKNILVSSYLSTSGSNHITNSNAFIVNNQVNLTHIVKIAEIGTCDMKLLTTITVIDKDNFNINNDYIVRFVEEDSKNYR